FGARREDGDVLRIAVREIRDGKEIRLLRPRGHARGGTRALNVEEDGRYLGVVRQAHELAHERDAGTRGGREGAGPHPPRSDYDARGRQLVLGLHDTEFLLSALLVDAELLAEALEVLHERRGWRDRIPRAHRRAGIHAP